MTWGVFARHPSGTPRWQPGSREEGPELGYVSGSYPHLLPATTGSTRRPVLHCFSVSCLNAKFLKGMAILLFLCLSEAEYRKRSMVLQWRVLKGTSGSPCVQRKALLKAARGWCVSALIREPTGPSGLGAWLLTRKCPLGVPGQRVEGSLAHRVTCPGRHRPAQRG